MHFWLPKCRECQRSWKRGEGNTTWTGNRQSFPEEVTFEPCKELTKHRRERGIPGREYSMCKGPEVGKNKELIASQWSWTAQYRLSVRRDGDWKGKQRVGPTGPETTLSILNFNHEKWEGTSSTPRLDSENQNYIISIDTRTWFCYSSDFISVTLFLGGVSCSGKGSDVHYKHLRKRFIISSAKNMDSLCSRFFIPCLKIHTFVCPPTLNCCIVRLTYPK